VSVDVLLLLERRSLFREIAGRECGSYLLLRDAIGESVKRVSVVDAVTVASIARIGSECIDGLLWPFTVSFLRTWNGSLLQSYGCLSSFDELGGARVGCTPVASIRRQYG
jgi:hypothetical protein